MSQADTNTQQTDQQNTQASSPQDLAELRHQIDAVDAQIQTLINHRARLAIDVASIKKQSDESPVFYRPEREAQVLSNVMTRNTGPLPADKMARLFREIMSACLDLEAPQKIAYLGPAGTFTHAAAPVSYTHLRAHETS